MSLQNLLELASYQGPRIATVGLVSGGYILTGKRRDNGQWTSPGGHLNDGEDVLTGALREVKEETGIDITRDQLEFIGAKKVPKGRGGTPFVVFCFLGHVDREKASGKKDPDQEVSEWKWVQLDKSTPELKEDARHAIQDDILVHLGINRPYEVRMSNKPLTKDENDKGRTMREVSEDILHANTVVPEPGPKSPADLQNPPAAYVPTDEVTGD